MTIETKEMMLRTEPFVLNFGPVHPSTHGVYRMRATLDGEVVLDIEPVFGYLHRGIEKLAEQRTFTGFIPLTDRLDYVSSMSNNMAYAMAVERLAGIKVPERAEYIRVIMAELQRIANHLIANGSFLNDCGAYFTPFLYMFREREKIIDLFEMVSGQRLTYNYMRVGGVSQDIPDEFLPALAKFVKQMPGKVDEYDRLLKQNEILLARAKGVGILSKEQAVNCGISGPILRASGVAWDWRRADPYSIYDRFEFDIPTASDGDCYDRFRVRMEEMRQSLRIVEQAMKQIPAGPVRAEVPHIVRPPAGEAYVHIEAPKGELGFYLVSDDSIAPYRCHVRPTSLINLTALREMVRGWKIADLIIIFGSIDICLGEVDR
ncbi:NAD(P)H-quinone oxidoreductase subunit H [subsurface metagenome]